MNPNVLAAKLRTLVLKVALGLGALVLLRDLYRILIAPGGWKSPIIPFTLAGNRPELAAKIVLPGFLNDIAVLRGLLDFLKSFWLFVTIPLAGILAVALIYFLYNYVIVPVFHWLARVLFLIVGVFTRGPKRRRHLIICIDGTWNYPDHYVEGIIATSNVFKFWQNLKGERRKWRELTMGAGRIKYYKSPEDDVLQIGLYFPGVGNPATYSSLGGIVGGAFGFGAENIREEAYRDIIRYYRTKADKITVVGFSRGAAISRMLATYIEQEGVPHLTLSDTRAGKFVVKILRTLLPKVKFIQKREVEVEFLGVWDTVASFGLAKNVLGIPFQRINLFKDFNVSRSVRHVVHLCAVDEQRDAFVPTLVQPPKPYADGSLPETKIEEVWFPGVHSNVGGGFTEDGLARISLGYMCGKFVEHYQGISFPVHLKATSFGTLEDNVKSRLRPSDSALYEMVPRVLPDQAVVHESVIRRMANAELEYCPPNVSALLERLEKKKNKAIEDLERLRDESLVSDQELSKANETLTRQCKLRVVA